MEGLLLRQWAWSWSGDRKMDGILRAISSGGWLAHQINQEWGHDHSKAVRPWYVGGMVALFGAGSGLVVCMLLFRGADAWDWIGVLLFGGFALLLTAGWLTNTVPFVAARESRNESAPGGRVSRGKALDTHATGVVGLGSDRRRFRHRPAVLERSSDGELHLTVKRWRSDLGASGAPVASVSARLLAGEVSKIRRGTAHLVTEARPAICFRWNHGPVLLDFADAQTRDRVYAELAALAVEGSSPGSL